MRPVHGVIAGLSLLLLLLQGQLWFGAASIPGWWELRGVVIEQRERNDRAAARNEALAAEVENLKEGTDALEERARYQLGMIREGETFYQVVEE